MPQIWPMNWLLLLVFFIFTFVIYICLTYFMISTKKSNFICEKNFTNELSNLNWKW